MARIEGMERRRTMLARLAFFLSRRSYGRVITPARVYALDSGLLLAVGTTDVASRLPMAACFRQRRHGLWHSLGDCCGEAAAVGMAQVRG